VLSTMSVPGAGTGVASHARVIVEAPHDLTCVVDAGGPDKCTAGASMVVNVPTEQKAV
jgi:hypothetical protein